MNVVICPACQVRFKVPDRLLGKKARCGKCGNAFRVPIELAPATEEPDTHPEPAEEPAPVAAVAVEPVDGEEPRPSRRRRARDVEADEEPARRRPPTPEEEANAEEPRQRPKKSRSLSTVLYGLLGAAALLLVVGGALLAWRYLGRTGSMAEMKFMPGDLALVVSVQAEQVLDSPSYKKLKELAPNADKPLFLPLFQRTGLGLGDVSTMFLGVGNDDENGILVVKTREAYNDQLILNKLMRTRSQLFTAKTVGPYTMQEGSGEAVCVADSKTLVFGTPKTLRGVLERNAPPALTPGMQSALRLVDFSRSLALAIDLKDSGQLNRMRGQLMVLGVPPAVDVDGMGMEVKVDAAVDIKSILVFANPAAAEDAKKNIDRQHEMVLNQMHSLKDKMPGLAEVLAEQKTELEGPRVITTLNLHIGPWVRPFGDLAENFSSVGPAPGPGPGAMLPGPRMAPQGEAGRPGFGSRKWLGTVQPRQQGNFQVDLPAGSQVQAAVTTTVAPTKGGTPEPEVNLKVYGPANDLLAADERAGKDCQVGFVAFQQGNYRFSIENLGPGVAQCTLAVNHRPQ